MYRGRLEKVCEWPVVNSNDVVIVWRCYPDDILLQVAPYVVVCTSRTEISVFEDDVVKEFENGDKAKAYAEGYADGCSEYTQL